jgi:hypothetical protein
MGEPPPSTLAQISRRNIAQARGLSTATADTIDHGGATGQTTGLDIRD